MSVRTASCTSAGISILGAGPTRSPSEELLIVVAFLLIGGQVVHSKPRGKPGRDSRAPRKTVAPPRFIPCVDGGMMIAGAAAMVSGEKRCPKCNGRGERNPRPEVRACPRCHGT